MRGYFPCGACRAYIDERRGCEHFKVPSMTKNAIQHRARRAAAKAERDRTPAERAALLNAQAAERIAEQVRAFHRTMNLAVTG